MKIIYCEKEPESMFCQEVFGPAITNICDYIQRPDVKLVIKDNIGSNFNEKAYDNALRETYTLKVIRQKSEIGAFACCYPRDDPQAIYVNPVLMYNLLRTVKGLSLDTTSSEDMKHKKPRTGENGETSSKPSDVNARRSLSAEDVLNQLILFVTVKLAHELSHLLNIQCSPDLEGRDSTPPRDKIDTMVDGTTKTVNYNDFGEMVEHDALHGLWELTASDKSLFMVPEFIVVYPSHATRIGRYLDVPNTYIDRRGAQVATYGQYKSITTPTFSTLALKGGNGRLSSNSREGSGSFDQADNEEEGADAPAWIARL